jgi:molybdopterin-binding protein
VEEGDYFILLGESGAGKTVVLELIAGLLTPGHGRILMGGRDLARVPVQERRLGLVYQDRALFPHLTVRGNIKYALARRERCRVEACAAQVGASGLLDRMPGTLSLGEAQRVALARALVRHPRLLLLDEPLASLDAPSRTAIRSLLRRLNAGGQTIVHVTHDYEEALALASRVAVLENGRIVQSGSPEEVFHRPRSRFVAGFTGVKNFFRGRVHAEGEQQWFLLPGARFALPPGHAPGHGCIVFESDAVTVSPDEPRGSARNVFQGAITDAETVPKGVELTVDIGLPVHALVTAASFRQLGLAPGRSVWISFKSTAIRFIPDEDVHD